MSREKVEALFGAFCSNNGDKPVDEQQESTSALLNEDVCTCPKCKKGFGTAIVDGVAVYYCEPCRVTHPIPTNTMAS